MPVGDRLVEIDTEVIIRKCIHESGLVHTQTQVSGSLTIPGLFPRSMRGPLISTLGFHFDGSDYNAVMSVTPASPKSAGSSGTNTTRPSLKKSLFIGAIGFGPVSLLIFGSVDFTQRWLYSTIGFTGAYLVWIAAYILIGGAALSPLLAGPRRLARFYPLFATSFFAYGISWTFAYFLLRGAPGEWMGAVAASTAMAVVIAAWFKVLKAAWWMAVWLFVAHSIGYFVGSIFFYSLDHRTGLLVWGPFFGAWLGAGIGAVLYYAQSRNIDRVSAEAGLRP